MPGDVKNNNLPDAFGVVRGERAEALKCDDHILVQYDFSLNKKTGVFEVVEKDSIDLTEVIQSNKDNCGLNLALLNISRGCDPANYCDDGKHGGDFSASTNINVAYQEALAAQQVAENVAKKLGIDVPKDGANLDEIITKAVQDKIANLVKVAPSPVPVNPGEGDKK